MIISGGISPPLFILINLKPDKNRLNNILVFKIVLIKMECKNCKSKCIKKGFNKTKQRWFCKCCKHHCQNDYVYRICNKEDEDMIIRLQNEGVGINGIGRLLKISKSNIVNKIRKLGLQIIKPEVIECSQEYEVDEMYTFIKNKNDSCYITYALNKKTKQVIDFVVGKRTKENIGKVIEKLILLNPIKIFTDKLNIYPGLIDKSIHVANAYKINHIERFNLQLRTQLKRLSRKTICFSKSKSMLENCLRLYLWGCKI